MRGNLFENLVLIEILKYRYNRGKRNNLYFYRDSLGNEIDVIYNMAQYAVPIEIKAGETVVADFFKGFSALEKVVSNINYGKVIIYGGDHQETRNDIKILRIVDIHKILDEIA